MTSQQPEHLLQNTDFTYGNIPVVYTQNSFPQFTQQMQHMWPQQWNNPPSVFPTATFNPTVLAFGMSNGMDRTFNDSGYTSGLHTTGEDKSGTFDQSSFQVLTTPDAETDESPAPKNTYDEEKEFCIPGRLGLLNSNKSYIIGMEEIQRRLNSPEKLNASYINGIIRKAKGKSAGQKLREKLGRNNLNVEHGRRTNVKATCFLPLCEQESMNIARDFDFLLSKFMPRVQLKQALRAAVKDNLKTLRNDISQFTKSIGHREDTTAVLIRLFQFLPHELAHIFDEDHTLKIQQEQQGGPVPLKNAEIQFGSQLQEALWNLNLATHNFAGHGLKAIFRNTSTPFDRNLSGLRNIADHPHV